MRCPMKMKIVFGLSAVLLAACTAASSEGPEVNVESAFTSSDLWMSVLTLPPSETEKALGAFVHCPKTGRAKIDLYEFSGLATKRELGSFDAAASKTAHGFLLVVGNLTSPTLKLTVDTSQSFSTSPFEYPSQWTMASTVYRPDAQQSRPDVQMQNPAHPTNDPQPEWNVPLSLCTL
jgi:hypothetical protein